VVPVVSPHLAAAGAAWDDGPAAGRWIADMLGSFTGDQPVHSGMWEGWGWWYDTRELAAARERLAAEGVERPDVEPLDLPHRRYHLWTGPLASATAFGHEPESVPSLIWPEDRSWFAGVPIYTNEIAFAGTTAIVDAVVADPRLDARRATPDYVLAGED
jgi:hypothetical protein